jgi:hypothetical protein
MILPGQSLDEEVERGELEKTLVYDLELFEGSFGRERL